MNNRKPWRRRVTLVSVVLLLAGCGTANVVPNTPATAAADSVEDRVCNVAAELLGVDRARLSGETSLADLGADDLDCVELVMELEDTFNISIPDDRAEKLFESGDWSKGSKNVTMSKLAALVRERQKSP
jgi:acyl carrier protein